MGKGKLLQKVPKGPRSFVLLFFNLSPFINKLRGDEVIRSCTTSNGGRRGEEVQLEWDMKIDQS